MKLDIDLPLKTLALFRLHSEEKQHKGDSAMAAVSGRIEVGGRLRPLNFLDPTSSQNKAVA